MAIPKVNRAVAVDRILQGVRNMLICASERAGTGDSSGARVYIRTALKNVEDAINENAAR